MRAVQTAGEDVQQSRNLKASLCKKSAIAADGLLLMSTHEAFAAVWGCCTVGPIADEPVLAIWRARHHARVEPEAITQEIAKVAELDDKLLRRDWTRVTCCHLLCFVSLVAVPSCFLFLPVLICTARLQKQGAITRGPCHAASVAPR